MMGRFPDDELVVAELCARPCSGKLRDKEPTTAVVRKSRRETVIKSSPTNENEGAVSIACKVAENDYHSAASAVRFRTSRFEFGQSPKPSCWPCAFIWLNK